MIDCDKSKGLPCGDSPSVCVLTKTAQCCWHTDERTYKEKTTIFLDKYGFVNLSNYRIDVPVDIHYCIGCKKTKLNRDDLTNILRARLNSSELGNLEAAEYQRLLKEERSKEKRHKEIIYQKIMTDRHNENIKKYNEYNAEYKRIQNDIGKIIQRDSKKKKILEEELRELHVKYFGW